MSFCVGSYKNSMCLARKVGNKGKSALKCYITLKIQSRLKVCINMYNLYIYNSHIMLDVPNSNDTTNNNLKYNFILLTHSFVMNACSAKRDYNADIA